MKNDIEQVIFPIMSCKLLNKWYIDIYHFKDLIKIVAEIVSQNISFQRNLKVIIETMYKKSSFHRYMKSYYINDLWEDIFKVVAYFKHLYKNLLKDIFKVIAEMISQ